MEVVKVPGKMDGFVTQVAGGWEAAAHGSVIGVFETASAAIGWAFAAIGAGGKVWRVEPDGSYEEVPF